MELVVEPKADGGDPVARALVLVLEPREEERVERVDEEVADGARGRHVGPVVRDRVVAATRAVSSGASLKGVEEGGALVKAECVALVRRVRVLRVAGGKR